MPILYCDLDGVLADFDGHYRRAFGINPRGEPGAVDWDALRRLGDFYANVAVLPDGRLLWDQMTAWRPVVLTALPYSIPEVADYKRDWVRRHLGEEVKIICCKSRTKYLYARPGDILVDDRDVDREAWVAAGGVFIAYRSAREVMDALRAAGGPDP